MQYVFDDDLVFSFQKVVEKSLKEFSKEGSLIAFQKVLDSGMKNIKASVQKNLLQSIDNQLVEDTSTRKGWVIQRRNDEKTILSPFGPVTYHRTYFKNNSTGKYAHLADKIVGYTPHQRLDALLEANFVDAAAELSYRKAGMSLDRHVPGTGVSGQTVLNLVRKFKPEQIPTKEQAKVKKDCKVIYIEADEDHVPHQDPGVRAFQQKLVYVHEGAERIGKNRNKLIGRKYFTFPPGTKSEEIWNTIWRYLDDTYELEKAEHIFILGDGAGWIKSGAEYIPDARYVMDGFHLKQAIYRAAGADEDKRNALARAVWTAKWGKMNRLLISLLEDAKIDSRRNTIKNVIGYLNNNWGGIKARRAYRDVLVGCSAEGHVSHVLAARLSSRPMGWSYLGADQMSHLRVHRANGINLRQTYLERVKQEKRRLVDAELGASLKALPKASGFSYEVFDNIPGLRRGSGLSLDHLLRRISNADSSF